MSDNNLSTDTLAYITKIDGVSAVSLASDRVNLRHISTGIYSLDLALAGGIPESGITEIFGQASSGKTTTCYKIIGNAQKKYPDGICAFVDLEGMLKPNAQWAEQNGVDLEKLIVVEPSSGESAVDITIKLLEDPKVTLVIFDSVPAMVSEKRWENSVEDQVMAEFAKLLQPMLQKANKTIIDSRKLGLHKTLIFINQWRLKSGFSMGDPRILPGGQSQHFFPGLRLEIFNKEQLGKTTEGFDVVSHNAHSFKVHKYKVSNAIKEGEFTLCRNPDGELPPGTVDDFVSVVNTAQKFGLVKGAGQAWALFSAITGEELKFRTKSDIVTYMKEHEDEYTAMKQFTISLFRKKLNLNPDIYTTEYNS